MIPQIKLTNETVQELYQEKGKLALWIASANPFGNPHELSQEEVIVLKNSYNAIIRLLFLNGSISEISYLQDLYVVCDVIEGA